MCTPSNGNQPSSASSGCNCRKAIKDDARSVSFARLKEVSLRAEKLLADRLGKSKRLIEDSKVQIFDRGFGIGAWAGTKRDVAFAGVGVVDGVPTEGVVSFDTDFFEGKGKCKDSDVLWLRVDIGGPIPDKLKIPLRGVGVLRDPESGGIIKMDSFELATDLLTDAKEVLKKILCILACVGWACYAACAAACVTVLACVACLIACVGASLPQFLVCLRACGYALDEIEEAIT